MHPRLEAVYDLFKPMPETNVYYHDGEVVVHFANARESIVFWVAGDELICEVRRHDAPDHWPPYLPPG